MQQTHLCGTPGCHPALKTLVLSGGGGYLSLRAPNTHVYTCTHAPVAT